MKMEKKIWFLQMESKEKYRSLLVKLFQTFPNGYIIVHFTNEDVKQV